MHSLTASKTAPGGTWHITSLDGGTWHIAALFGGTWH